MQGTVIWFSKSSSIEFWFILGTIGSRNHLQTLNLTIGVKWKYELGIWWKAGGTRGRQRWHGNRYRRRCKTRQEQQVTQFGYECRVVVDSGVGRSLVYSRWGSVAVGSKRSRLNAPPIYLLCLLLAKWDRCMQWIRILLPVVNFSPLVNLQLNCSGDCGGKIDGDGSNGNRKPAIYSIQRPSQATKGNRYIHTSRRGDASHATRITTFLWIRLISTASAKYFSKSLLTKTRHQIMLLQPRLVS